MEHKNNTQKQKSIKTNFVFNFIKVLLSLIFPLITFPYASRILLPEGIGKVDFANSIIAYFILIASLGINTYAIREGAKVRDDKEKLSKIEQTGKIIIQSKYIIDIIRKMPSDEINIEVIDGLKIRIYTETSQYNLNCLNSADYPQIILEESNNPIYLNNSLYFLSFINLINITKTKAPHKPIILIFKKQTKEKATTVGVEPTTF